MNPAHYGRDWKPHLSKLVVKDQKVSSDAEGDARVSKRKENVVEGRRWVDVVGKILEKEIR